MEMMYCEPQTPLFSLFSCKVLVKNRPIGTKEQSMYSDIPHKIYECPQQRLISKLVLIIICMWHYYLGNAGRLKEQFTP